MRRPVRPHSSPSGPQAATRAVRATGERPSAPAESARPGAAAPRERSPQPDAGDHASADTAAWLARLGERIRARRSSRALTLRELGSRADVSQRFLVSLEAGRANVSVTRLEAIARALGTNAAALLGGADDTPARAAPGASQVIALLGLRGSGKTAVGERGAARLGVHFVELDARVSERAGMPLESLFELHGIDHYRRLEREELERVLALPERAVLATGGGIVTDTRTFALLRRSALTVFLRASAEDHWNRVVAQGDARPMHNRRDAMHELRAILRARLPLYLEAAHMLDTSTLGLDRTVSELVRLARAHWAAPATR